MIWGILVVCVFYLMKCQASGAAEICFDKGFNSNILQCNTCELLLQIVGDGEFYTDCKECCLQQAEEELFEKIVLEVDKRFLMGYPEIAALVKEKKQHHLTVKYKMGTRPSLFLYKSKADETPFDSVFVNSWGKDAIVDFIKSHIAVKER